MNRATVFRIIGFAFLAFAALTILSGRVSIGAQWRGDHQPRARPRNVLAIRHHPDRGRLRIALPQTDEACFGCGSDRRFMTSFGRTRLR